MMSLLRALMPTFVGGWPRKRAREQGNDEDGQVSDKDENGKSRPSCSNLDQAQAKAPNVDSSRKPYSCSGAKYHEENDTDAYQPARKKSCGERERSASAQADGRQTVSSNQKGLDGLPIEIDSASPSFPDALQSGHHNHAPAQRQLLFATPLKSTESHQPDVEPTYTSARQDALHAAALQHQQHSPAGVHDDAERRLGIRLAHASFNHQNGSVTPMRQATVPQYESRSAQVTIGLARRGSLTSRPSPSRASASPLPAYRPTPPRASLYDEGLRPLVQGGFTSPARLHELLNAGNSWTTRTPSLSSASMLDARALQPLQLPAEPPNADDVKILSVSRGSQRRASAGQDQRQREQADHFKQLDEKWKQQMRDPLFEAKRRCKQEQAKILEERAAVEVKIREILERRRKALQVEESPERAEVEPEESEVIEVSESEEEQEVQQAGIAIETRELTVEEQDEYQALLDIGVPTAEICSHAAANLVLKASDFETFGPHGWLSDECINMYMALLQDRDSRFRDGNVSTPRVWFCNTFFMGKLYLDSNSFNFAGVQRWSTAKRLQKLGLTCSNVFELDKVVVPCHLGNHWTCACVNLRDKQLEYYDSLGGRHNELLDALGKWLESEHKHKLNQAAPPEWQATQWDRVVNPQGTPRQQNGWDCGVFTLMCAAYISKDRPFDYDQQDVHYYFRAKCALQCKRQLVE